MASVPDPFSDPIILGVLGLVIGLAVLTFIEVEYVRRAIRGERTRRKRQAEQLPDDAHNALVTAKAVAASLRQGGVMTDEADSLLAEADRAMARRNHRVVLELTDRAKGILKAEKARHDRFGDAARLDRIAGGPEAVTTKEQLAKEHPENYAASKFSIDRAEQAVAAGRSTGRDMALAEQSLQLSRDRFAAADYGAALAIANQARKVAEVPSPVVVVSSSGASTSDATAPAGLTCRSCGASLVEGDAFCRRCGTKAAA